MPLAFLPNLLSLFRLIGAFALLCSITSPWALFLVFSLISASDFFDGWAARRFGGVSTVGRLLDPLADKCLAGCTYCLLWKLGMAPLWLALLIIARDVGIVCGVLYLWTRRALRSPTGSMVSPILLSKVNTFFQFLYAWLALGAHVGLWAFPFEYGTCVVALFTIASGISYLEILYRWPYE
ncbi:MAG: CDP-alcohol phosphatidyltransferase family protein [Holosporales bacterium]|jgi:cardiolipin synthase|nr:CDP-alcohol phosphatidyltransferase family protein [Holosporales bacterium]